MHDLMYYVCYFSHFNTYPSCPITSMFLYVLFPSIANIFVQTGGLMEVNENKWWNLSPNLSSFQFHRSAVTHIDMSVAYAALHSHANNDLISETTLTRCKYHIWNTKNKQNKLRGLSPQANYTDRPPLWSSGQSSWLQIQRYAFDSWRYQTFSEK
jgi:hypothetical protein